MSLRSIIITEYLHGSNDLNSRSISRYNNNTLLTVAIRIIRVALSEDKMQGTSWVTSTADPPFVAVDNDFIALLTDGGANVSGVG